MWFTDDNGHGVGKVTLGLAPIVSAGGASGVSGSGAVVSAAVNPAGGAVSSVEFQYGRSTAYGSSVAATPRALGASGQPSSVSARLAGLPADTLIHYRAVATNPYGTTYGADHTFRTASAAAKPALGRVQETHSRWREAGGGSRKATPEGTTFSFTLSAPATVHFTLTRRRRVSSFSVAGHSGRNTVRFAGRVSHHRLLAPGRYVVLVQADNPGGRSPVRRLSFTILRG